jgi:hypothetical protein
VIFLQQRAFIGGAARHDVAFLPSRGPMCRVSENHEWRAYLELCWRMAQEASTESERCSWADMAARWRLLIITQEDASIGQSEFYHSSERASSHQLQAAEKILKLYREFKQKSRLNKNLSDSSLRLF